MTDRFTVEVRSEQRFNGTGTLRPFSTKYFFANPRYDADAPRLLDGAFNPAAVRESGGLGRADTLVLIRHLYAGYGAITVAWDDRAPQTVRTYPTKEGQ